MNRPDFWAGFPYMARIVPAGQSGDVVVEHETITDHGGAHAVTHGYSVTNGTYAILKVRGDVMMSDTDAERRSNIGALVEARGDVLIGGLGLGMVLCPILCKPDVRTVTVVERSMDVIRLVGPAVRAWAGQQFTTGPTVWADQKLTIICDDVFTWRPAQGQKFDSIYFDIWPDVCETNLDEIARLHNRAKAWKRPGGWMNSWQADVLRSRRRLDNRRGYS